MARYIDADELELEYYGFSIHGTMVVKSVLPIFADLLAKQPTADVVEVKHGEWIIAPCSEKDGNANCSNCSYWDWSDNNFCPNCGAKMDRQKEATT